MSNPLPQDQPVASALIARMKAGRRDELGGAEVGTPLRQGDAVEDPRNAQVSDDAACSRLPTDRFTAYLSLTSLRAIPRYSPATRRVP